MYYTYILRCTDNSLYTGMTKDLTRRMQEHFSGRRKMCQIHFASQTAKVRDGLGKRKSNIGIEIRISYQNFKQSAKRRTNSGT